MLAPLQLVDSFLLNYNVGDALLVAFALGFLATLPLKSWRAITLHILGFGLLFLVVPAQMLAVSTSGAHFLASALQYKLLGLGLLVVAPVLYTTGNR
ncbi:MAG: hypothetical protein BRD23_06895 [Halobacteriales archaeon SW_9_67_25]|nr:MAG: hypothetical protein BRD23_06895 [Halobacteriales archaeon SW_9_67_25]